jgi:hypothetical protein
MVLTVRDRRGDVPDRYYQIALACATENIGGGSRVVHVLCDTGTGLGG